MQYSRTMKERMHHGYTSGNSIDLDQQDINLKKSNYEKRIKWDIDREA